MKAYRLIDTYFAPGTQPKGAEKIDVPTDTQGLVAFLNDLVEQTKADASVVPLARQIAQVEEALQDHKVEPQPTALMDRVQAFTEARGRPPHPFAVEMGRKQLQEAAEAPRITDEAFEALPLPYQLHLAALALENARGRLKG